MFQAHMHYEVLVLFTTVRDTACWKYQIVHPIIVTVGVKTVTAMHRHHYKLHFTITTAFFDQESHLCKQQTEICIAPHRAVPLLFCTEAILAHVKCLCNTITNSHGLVLPP